MKKILFLLVSIMLLLGMGLPVQAGLERVGTARLTVTSGNITHIVQPGETLFAIARRYGVDPWALARANGLVNPNYIFVGQQIVISSGSTSTGTPGGVHIVRYGDTLQSIASTYGVSVWALAQVNGIYNLNYIYAGQRLIIPGSPTSPTPAPVSPPAVPPTPTPKPAVTQPVVSAGGTWRGEYYAGTEPTGEPVFIREDRAVNFHWGLSSPDTRLNTDNFSVRWTRTINFQGGLYRFTALADDGVRIRVAGMLILDVWQVGAEVLHEVDVILPPGQHPVMIDYFEGTGNAVMEFSFKRLGDTPPQFVSTLTPVGTPTPSAYQTGIPSHAWLGEYFGNVNLSGAPVITRMDDFIGFEWGQAAPMDGIPDEFFSVRWTRMASFWEDNYAFCVRADDGVRLYLDGSVIIDEWHGSKGDVASCKEVDLTKGNHKIQVDYYEEGRDALIYVWWERR
ncbi:MAG: LysM peptidoglycan-binding domain-containing protein [Anaerolineae bacterium]|nr:LysM peptidoglycan-binding domain-containing protein [Anaerolineae bacterium]